MKFLIIQTFYFEKRGLTYIVYKKHIFIIHARIRKKNKRENSKNYHLTSVCCLTKYIVNRHTDDHVRTPLRALVSTLVEMYPGFQVDNQRPGNWRTENKVAFPWQHPSIPWRRGMLLPSPSPPSCPGQRAPNCRNPSICTFPSVPVRSAVCRPPRVDGRKMRAQASIVIQLAMIYDASSDYVTVRANHDVRKTRGLTFLLDAACTNRLVSLTLSSRRRNTYLHASLVRCARVFIMT